jgi:hypothetical protein
LRNCSSSFVIDGEAVLLGVDGISDFNGLHSGLHDDEVQLNAFCCIASLHSPDHKSLSTNHSHSGLGVTFHVLPVQFACLRAMVVPERSG